MPPRVPALRPDKIIQALEACGLVVVRQRGSHVLLSKQGLARPVVMARHNKELPPGIVSSLLRQADVSIEDFLKHL